MASSVSGSDSDSPDKFLRDVVELIFKSIFEVNRQTKVIEWTEPEKLKEILDLKAEINGESKEQLLKLVGDTLNYSVKTGHPYFINQLFSG